MSDNKKIIEMFKLETKYKVIKAFERNMSHMTFKQILEKFKDQGVINNYDK